jgi:hypothetical protein
VVTKTSVWDGMFSGVSCFLGEVRGCVPGLRRTGSPVVPQWFSLKHLSTRVMETICENLFEISLCMCKFAK